MKVKCDTSICKASKKRFRTTDVLIDILIITAVTSSIVLYYFRGPTTGADVNMHLSRVRIIMSSFPIFPRWNPYWYFGMPFLRVYSGLFHYSLALLSLLISHMFPNLSTSEAISLSITIYTPLIFSVGAISLYFLARELELPRFGATSASLLLITSYNLYEYWAIGSYPNIASLLISPLPLALYIRGLSEKKMNYAILSGFTYGIVALMYLPNAICLALFFAIISLLILMHDHELLLTLSKARGHPPKYTLIILKFAGLTIASTVMSAGWWLIPFYTSVQMRPTPATRLTITPLRTTTPLIDVLSAISGVKGFNIRTPGICHFTLVLLSLFLFIKFRQRKATWGILMTIFSLTSHIIVFCTGYKLPFVPSGRFTLFFSLFGSIAGGFALSILIQSYKKLSLGYNLVRNSLPLFIGLIILSSVFSSMLLFVSPFPTADIPQWNETLEQKVKVGERVGVRSGYDLNLYSNIWQSGGGSVESMSILNEYAYTFWYYIFYREDIRYLPYFSRNYNVRYIMEPLKGLKKTKIAGLYEVSDFKSSIVEVIPEDSLLILHIGSKTHYSYLLVSSALSGESELILVEGGENIEDFSIDDLRHFDLLYISDTNIRDENAYVSLIDAYLREGGVVLFDTGQIPSMFQTKLLDLLPIKEIRIGTSNLQLKFSPILGNMSFSPFNSIQNTQILYADGIKKGAEVLAWDENGNPVLVRIKRYGGWIVWSGISVTYQIIRVEDYEGACLLIYLIRFLTSYTPSRSGKIRCVVLKVISTDEYEVNLPRLSTNDAVWFKMTYYPGWEAIIKDTNEKLKIFLAGPHTMLVFPGKSSSLKIIFRFGKTLSDIIGECVSIIFYIILFIYFILYKMVIRHHPS